MSTVSAGHIFISYSRQDHDVMWRMVRFLRERGIKVWLDDERLIPGTPIWEVEIEKAIKAASAVIVVMSPDSKNSEWVRREISLADQNRKQIIPVLVRGDEDTSISLRLITRQYVDMREDKAAGLNSLYAALGTYLNEQDVHFEEAISNRNVENISPKLEVMAEPVSGQTMLITLAWAVAGAIAGVSYNATGSPLAGGAVGGAIGGLATAFIHNDMRSNSKRLFGVALAWTIGSTVGWVIGEVLTEAIGMAIGYAIGITISMALIVSVGQIGLSWKSMAWIVIAWTIGAGLGWWISRRFLIDQLDFAYEIAWAIGIAIGWAIGGYVLGWQLSNERGNK